MHCINAVRFFNSQRFQACKMPFLVLYHHILQTRFEQDQDTAKSPAEMLQSDEGLLPFRQMNAIFIKRSFTPKCCIISTNTASPCTLSSKRPFNCKSNSICKSSHCIIIRSRRPICLNSKRPWLGILVVQQ